MLKTVESSGLQRHFETAFSADLTAPSEFFVGQNDHLPVHFESNEKGSVRYGDFKGTGGRTLYGRGRLRQSGPPPFGPEEFEIQMGPFPNQPIQHELSKERTPQSQPQCGLMITELVVGGGSLNPE